MAEYFVFPYRNQKMSYIDSFHRLVDTLDMEIVEVFYLLFAILCIVAKLSE